MGTSATPAGVRSEERAGLARERVGTRARGAGRRPAWRVQWAAVTPADVWLGPLRTRVRPRMCVRVSQRRGVTYSALALPRCAPRFLISFAGPVPAGVRTGPAAHADAHADAGQIQRRRVKSSGCFKVCGSSMCKLHVGGWSSSVCHLFFVRVG
jgi:hypothetical protein